MRRLFTTRWLTLLPALALISSLAVGADDSQPLTWTYDPQHPEADCPSKPTCSAWLQFRRSHPWPYQTFAIKEDGAESTVILSEPSPVLSREQLLQVVKALFGQDLLSVAYNRWPTGLDGWLEDLVIRVRSKSHARAAVMSGATLSPWKAPADIADRLQMLHRLIHGTSDGFWLDRLSDTPLASKPIVELKTPVSDIVGWLYGKAAWSDSAGLNLKKTSQQLLAEKASGVYYRDPGIIALVAPSGLSASSLAPDFHRFAVASDLLIGAVGLNSGGMLLLGRSRQVPFATLPPLRHESFATFARNKTEHLAQSYERQRIFAGRIKSGVHSGWDWAPILLSPQLDDTEFGTLLNLADQILKSWSQHGEVEYYAFAHPKPDSYPFGSHSASEYFRKSFLTTSLLFNWNTEGLATLTNVNGRQFLTGDRTGALPVLYRPSNSLLTQLSGTDVSTLLSKVESESDARALEARDYFATMGDPLLVRVVQNVFLSQATQSFLTVNDPPENAGKSRSDQVVAVLEKRAIEWLTGISRGTVEADMGLRTLLNNFMKRSGLNTEQMARVLASPQSVERDYQRALQKYRDSASQAEATSKYLLEARKNGRALFLNTCAGVGGQVVETAEGRMCRWKSTFGSSRDQAFLTYETYIANLKAMEANYNATINSLSAQRQSLWSFGETYLRAVEIAEGLSKFSSRVDLDEVLRSVLLATSARATSTSIRTPPVVLSKNTVDVLSVGGHNIDLIPRKSLVAPKIPNSVGPVRRRDPIEILPDLSPPRSEAEALQTHRKGSLLDEMRIMAEKSELPQNRRAELEAKAKACQCDAVVVQGEDGVIYFSRNAPPPEQRALFGKTSIVDALAGPPPVKVVRFENLPDSTVENVARTAALSNSGGSRQQGGFARAVEGITGMFKSDESRSTRQVHVTIERVGREPEVLRLSEGAESITSLRQTISWRSSSIESTPAQQKTWTDIFGPDAAFDPQTSDALIVRFGPQVSTTTSLLGIRIAMTPSQRQGSIDRLRQVLGKWIGIQPVKARPWAESIIELREAIRRQLKPLELDFYYKHNKGKVRAADLGFPKVCRTGWRRV